MYFALYVNEFIDRVVKSLLWPYLNGIFTHIGLMSHICIMKNTIISLVMHVCKATPSISVIDSWKSKSPFY